VSAYSRPATAINADRAGQDSILHADRSVRLICRDWGCRVTWSGVIDFFAVRHTAHLASRYRYTRRQGYQPTTRKIAGAAPQFLSWCRQGRAGPDQRRRCSAQKRFSHVTRTRFRQRSNNRSFTQQYIPRKETAETNPNIQLNRYFYSRLKSNAI